MKELSREGNIAQHKKADVITLADENLMWHLNVLGSSTPKKLVNTMLYMFGVHFALRATVEHRSLRIGPNSQLSLGLDRDKRFLEYREDVSKTRQGGIEHRNVGRKIVRAYVNISEPDKCIINLYEKYLSHHPIHINIDNFYLRPLAGVHGNTWYASQPIGHNTLSKVVASLAEEAGLKGNYSNHSLHATAASHLYNANVDEQLISEVTGHRSNAVRGYKCTSNDQLKSVSNILYCDLCHNNHDDKCIQSERKIGRVIKNEAESDSKKCKVDVDVNSNMSNLPVNVNVTVNINK